MVALKKEHSTHKIVCWIPRPVKAPEIQVSQEQHPLIISSSAPREAFHWTAAPEISLSIRNNTLISLSLPSPVSDGGISRQRKKRRAGEAE